MNDVDRWIYFDGPEPESVRPLLEALREVETPRPTLEHKARVLAGLLETLDARLEGVTESRVEVARGRAPAVAVPAPAAPAAPFAPFAPFTPEPPEENALAPRPVDVRARSPFSGTGDAVDLPAAVLAALGKLPFKAATATAAAGPAARRQDLAKTKPMAVMRSHLGETLPLDDDALQKAVAAVPFAGSPGGVGIVPFPSLTVQQYVSLRAELAVRPESAGETLRRYGVPSAASRRALEEHWREQLAASPELRAELDAAVATYMRWLVGLVR